jgi:hypothetical protein
MVAVDDRTKIDHILKFLTVFKRTCNTQEEIDTVKQLTSELGLDTIELDKIDEVTELPGLIKELLEKYKSEELNKIYDTLMEISTRTVEQISDHPVCINDDNTKITHCLEKKSFKLLRTIDQKKCPTVPAPTDSSATTAATDSSATGSTGSDIPAVAASVGGKKSKRRKHRRKNNRKTKKQRKNKRR